MYDPRVDLIGIGGLWRAKAGRHGLTPQAPELSRLLSSGVSLPLERFESTERCCLENSSVATMRTFRLV